MPVPVAAVIAEALHRRASQHHQLPKLQLPVQMCCAVDGRRQTPQQQVTSRFHHDRQQACPHGHRQRHQQARVQSRDRA